MRLRRFDDDDRYHGDQDGGKKQRKGNREKDNDFRLFRFVRFADRGAEKDRRNQGKDQVRNSDEEHHNDQHHQAERFAERFAEILGGRMEENVQKRDRKEKEDSERNSGKDQKDDPGPFLSLFHRANVIDFCAFGREIRARFNREVFAFFVHFVSHKNSSLIKSIIPKNDRYCKRAKLFFHFVTKDEQFGSMSRYNARKCPKNVDFLKETQY